TTAVVGAPYANSYTGAAYVFTKVAGTWLQQAELLASDGASNDEFGWSVAISGSTVVVGAPARDFGIGAAYVFSDGGGTWTQQAELTGSDSSGGDKFGSSVVAASASQVMVGAKGHAATGAVYVFSDSGGPWGQAQELSDPEGGADDMFGWSMATSGATLVVSAVKAHNDTGAVFVYTPDGDGNWTERAELSAADGFANDYFGDKVAISGNRIVAGAPGHNSEQGAAYVFSGSGATWKQTDELTASDGQHNDCFGWAVGLAGKTVLVGAEQTDNDNGAAYVFKLKGGSKWRQTDELSETTTGVAGEFGYSSSLSGTTALISADLAEGGAGTALIYQL
ncbi:MAG: FG-GAP repeat protein, partial [Acidimicrobiales bacterium]